MGRKQRVGQRRKRGHRKRIGQKGGLLPLAALIPALVAAGKAAALGAASGAAGWGAKKALNAATRKKPAASPAQIRQLKKALRLGNTRRIMANAL